MLLLKTTISKDRTRVGFAAASLNFIQYELILPNLNEIRKPAGQCSVSGLANLFYAAAEDLEHASNPSIGFGVGDQLFFGRVFR